MVPALPASTTPPSGITRFAASSDLGGKMDSETGAGVRSRHDEQAMCSPITSVAGRAHLRDKDHPLATNERSIEAWRAIASIW
jgi:hypothetical protein